MMLQQLAGRVAVSSLIGYTNKGQA